MSDLFDPLRPALREPAHPLPASEVRRRGDRMRRRRVAGTSLAAACAVVAIAATGVFANGQLQSSPPPVSPANPTPEQTESVSPDLEVITTIPAGFPLDAGMPPASSEITKEGPGKDVRFLSELQICGDASSSPADTATDWLSVTASGPEYGAGRALSLYADDAAARDAATDLVGKYQGCREFSTDGGTTLALTEVTPGELGDESWVVTRTYRADAISVLGQEIVHVIRLGSAVLVAQTAGEGPGATDEAAMGEAVAAEAEKLEPLLGELVAGS